jgi:hypothetical protein
MGLLYTYSVQFFALGFKFGAYFTLSYVRRIALLYKEIMNMLQVVAYWS